MRDKGKKWITWSLVGGYSKTKNEDARRIYSVKESYERHRHGKVFEDGMAMKKA